VAKHNQTSTLIFYTQVLLSKRQEPILILASGGDWFIRQTSKGITKLVVDAME
jgi:hypothetical protein